MEGVKQKGVTYSPRGTKLRKYDGYTDAAPEGTKTKSGEMESKKSRKSRHSSGRNTETEQPKSPPLSDTSVGKYGNQLASTQSILIKDGQRCTVCGIGRVHKHYTCKGYLAALLCPICGCIYCCKHQENVCDKCGAIYEEEADT